MCGLPLDEYPFAIAQLRTSFHDSALTSVRSYKEAWSRADAMDEIGRKSGSHFDPAVVRAFERVLPEMADMSPALQRAG